MSSGGFKTLSSSGGLWEALSPQHWGSPHGCSTLQPQRPRTANKVTWQETTELKPLQKYTQLAVKLIVFWFGVGQEGLYLTFTILYLPYCPTYHGGGHKTQTLFLGEGRMWKREGFSTVMTQGWLFHGAVVLQKCLLALSLSK